ncbi:MAG: chemotaxis protein CheW [Defluviitaleaceae bacterium]|nr:chemotaxis protein CheW [Defluviitaleaceae bacterium]
MSEEMLNGMTIIVDGKKFVLPISIIKRSFKAEEKSITHEPGGTRIIDTNEGITALLNMSDYLDLPPSDKPMDEQIVMLLEDKRRRVGVFVDALVGECKAMCKTLPTFCGDGAHIGGCALINDNEMCLLISHEGLFEGITPDGPEEEPIEQLPPPEESAIVIDKSGMENKYLTFELFNEDYAIQIEYVKEIITLSEITAVPKAPPYVEGIINRRGDIIPIINFRRMVMAPEATTPPTNIVILEHEGIPLGILIDKIKETLTIPEESVAPLPQNKESTATNYVSKSGRHDSNVYLILDLADIYAALQ